MGWNSAVHPRIAAGSSAGGQFSASGSSSKSTPKRSTKKPAAARKLPKAAKKVRSTKSRTVTVKRGDTLSGIARRSGESLGQLRKDNPGLFSKRHRGGNLIFPGNKVKLRPKSKTKPSKLKAATKIRSSKPVRLKRG